MNLVEQLNAKAAAKRAARKGLRRAMAAQEREGFDDAILRRRARQYARRALRG